MGRLISTGRAGDFDKIYDSLVNAFAGLDDEQCLDLSAALLVTLTNHIGDERIIEESIGIAKESLEDPA